MRGARFPPCWLIELPEAYFDPESVRSVRMQRLRELIYEPVHDDLAWAAPACTLGLPPRRGTREGGHLSDGPLGSSQTGRRSGIAFDFSRRPWYRPPAWAAFGHPAPWRDLVSPCPAPSLAFSNFLFGSPTPPVRVLAEFPGYPPYGGRFDSIVSHVTVAQGAKADLIEAERRLLNALPVLGFGCRCEAPVLIEDGNGRWPEKAVFGLGSSTTS